MKKVFISTSTFGQEDPSLLKELAKAKINFTLNPYGRRLSEQEITNILVKGGYDGLLAGLEPLTEQVFAAVKNLKVVSRVGVGKDNVDEKAALKYGIKVFNTPGVLTDAVAELTLGLILTALRQIAFLDRRMHTGQWDKKMGSLLKGKTLGIVGFGHIGQRVAELGLAFGAKIIFTDVHRIKKIGAKQSTMATLIKTADIISLHCSGKECLISDKQIKSTKQGVILINTARGALIDEAALLKGISSGKIACAGLDVFEQEPYQGKLIKEDRVILTPHIGSYAKEARILMERIAVENLIKGLKGGC